MELLDWFVDGAGKIPLFGWLQGDEKFTILLAGIWFVDGKIFYF